MLIRAEMEYKYDVIFMRKALEEAYKAQLEDEVPIGAVIVYNNEIIASAHNIIQSQNNAIAHAEILTINKATEFLKSKYLWECSLYVTIEPCLMCAGAIAWSQIPIIVYGAKDEKKGYSIYSENIFHPKIKIINGILEKECSEVIKNFFIKKRNNKK